MLGTLSEAWDCMLHRMLWFDSLELGKGPEGKCHLGKKRSAGWGSIVEGHVGEIDFKKTGLKVQFLPPKMEAHG
jgi:hypothetical protein